MSFILDALKKSETDRQQQGSAEFADVPTSKASVVVPRWLWVIGILLAVNLAVLIGLLLRPDSTQTVAEVPVTEPVTALPDDQSTGLPSFAEQVATARQNRPDPQQEIRTSERLNAQSGMVKPILISQDPASIPSSELYPSIHEVRASGTSDIPELHLDIHVYSDDPASRFVFVNMAKLREGSRLDEGPVVSEITPDGVVLEHEGQLFLLSRE
jgi:general secretion pathway protein B